MAGYIFVWFKVHTKILKRGKNTLFIAHNMWMAKRWYCVLPLTSHPSSDASILCTYLKQRLKIKWWLNLSIDINDS